VIRPGPARTGRTGEVALLGSVAMRISRSLYDEIVEHARADAPNECCGVIAVDGDEARHVYRAENVHASPLKFEIAPAELLRVYGRISDEDLELGGIYHSHTRSAPYPSQTDINFARNWPGVVWIIVGLTGEEPEVRAYEIPEGQVAQVTLQVG